MGINSKSVPSNGNGGNKPDPIEAGNYPARLVQVIDLGLQPQRPFKGEEKPPAYSIYTTYELLDEFMKDADGNDDETKPRWQSEEMPLYNIGADLAKSTKRYKALDADLECEGDWGQLLGMPVTVTITAKEGSGQHAGKVFNNISGTAPMRPKDAAKADELKNPPKMFDLDAPDLEVFQSLPDWLQEKIKGNLEFKGSKLEGMLSGAPADDTPDNPDNNGDWV
jgi:hypothetical protein